jgi:uncharacterized membrane protein YagU involved in acid resistance
MWPAINSKWIGLNCAILNIVFILEYVAYKKINIKKEEWETPFGDGIKSTFHLYMMSVLFFIHMQYVLNATEQYGEAIGTVLIMSSMVHTSYNVVIDIIGVILLKSTICANRI